MKKGLSRLVLGTAQLGFAYGIANREGMPDRKKASGILKAACACGITAFDTAAAYGESEKIIGAFLSPGNNKADIITKVAERGDGAVRAGPEMMKRFCASLKTLGQKRVAGVLLHSFRDFQMVPDACLGFFRDVKNQNMADMTGLSVYHPEEALSCLEHPEIDALQIPFNLFDQRWLDGPFLSLVKERGITLFIRSVYLQGLFFLAKEELAGKVPQAEPYREKLEKLSRTHGVSVRDMAFCFVRDQIPEAHMLFGAENEEQVRQNAALLSAGPLSAGLTDEILSAFRNVPEEVVNPGLWK